MTMRPSLQIRSAGSNIVQRAASIALLIGALAVTGCTSPTPVAYQQLQSANLLRPVKGSGEPFQYRNATAHLEHYSTIIVEPVAIYRGPDAQFGSVSQGDRHAIADYMQREFAK